MRRILFPILVIGLTAGLFTLGSGAFFSDIENSTGNTFTAGSLNLTVTGGDAAGDSVTKSCLLVNFFPPLDGNVLFYVGATEEGGVPPGLPTHDNCEITVNNTGSLAGDLYVEIVLSDDTDVTCTEPETVAEAGGCAPANTGELDSQLVISECTETVADGGGNDACSGITLNTSTLASIALGCSKVSDLTDVAGAYTGGTYGTDDAYTLVFDLNSTITPVDNQSQTDSIKIEFNFKLVQDGATAPVSCT